MDIENDDYFNEILDKLSDKDIDEYFDNCFKKDLETLKERKFKQEKCQKCNYSSTYEFDEYFSDDELNEICSDKDVKDFKHNNNKYCKCGGLIYCVVYTLINTK